MIKPVKKQLKIEGKSFPYLGYDDNGNFTVDTKARLMRDINPYVEPLKKEPILDNILITIIDNSLGYSRSGDIIVNIEYNIFVPDPNEIQVYYKQFKTWSIEESK